jgi:hypothetical protein
MMIFTSLEALLTTVAICIALLIGVGSWIQVSIIQRKERKHRLLNEIIDWALRLSACWNENYPISLIETDSKRIKTLKTVRINNLAHAYVVFQRQEEYFRLVASQFDSVLPALNDVLAKLDQLISALAQESFDIEDYQTNEQTSDANIALHDSLKNLLGLLTNIKIRL